MSARGSEDRLRSLRSESERREWTKATWRWLEQHNKSRHHRIAASCRSSSGPQPQAHTGCGRNECGADGRR
eukprot:scaffold124345_cov23-Tisochrysis_lutea.AAC.1